MISCSTTSYLGLGSNIQPQINIQQAKKLLAERFERVEFSATYESKAVGFSGDDFLNLVAKIDSQLSLRALIEALDQIEKLLGRTRSKQKFSSRSIDIDILLYGDLVCQQPIVLPRAEIYHQAYVLRPLAELAPDLIDPHKGISYRQLWQAFDQQAQPLKKVVNI